MMRGRSSAALMIALVPGRLVFDLGLRSVFCVRQETNC